MRERASRRWRSTHSASRLQVTAAQRNGRREDTQRPPTTHPGHKRFTHRHGLLHGLGATSSLRSRAFGLARTWFALLGLRCLARGRRLSRNVLGVEGFRLGPVARGFVTARTRGLSVVHPWLHPARPALPLRWQRVLLRTRLGHRYLSERTCSAARGRCWCGSPGPTGERRRRQVAAGQTAQRGGVWSAWPCPR